MHCLLAESARAQRQRGAETHGGHPRQRHGRSTSVHCHRRYLAHQSQEWHRLAQLHRAGMCCQVGLTPATAAWPSPPGRSPTAMAHKLRGHSGTVHWALATPFVGQAAGHGAGQPRPMLQASSAEAAALEALSRVPPARSQVLWIIFMLVHFGCAESPYMRSTYSHNACSTAVPQTADDLPARGAIGNRPAEVQENNIDFNLYAQGLAGLGG